MHFPYIYIYVFKMNPKHPPFWIIDIPRIILGIHDVPGPHWPGCSKCRASPPGEPPEIYWDPFLYIYIYISSCLITDSSARFACKLFDNIYIYIYIHIYVYIYRCIIQMSNLKSLQGTLPVFMGLWDRLSGNQNPEKLGKLARTFPLF